MPAEVSLDRETGIWTLVMSGPVDAREMETAIRRMYSSADYRPDAPRLYDVREVEDNIGTAELRELAVKPEFSQSVDGARSAIVVTEDVTFGIARMYQIYADAVPVEVQIFRDLDEARAWLLEGSGT